MSSYFSTPGCLAIAHRGASGYHPENSLESFSRALELGATATELDIWRVEDELVVFHDRRLERLTDGTGVVTEKSLDELRSLKLRNGEKIPFLSEVLDLLAGRCSLNIEIKGPNAEALLLKAIERAIATGSWDIKQFLISSFLHPSLKTIHDKTKLLHLGYLFHGHPLTGAKEASSLGCFSFNLALECVERKLVAEAHNEGLRVFVYTVNARDDMERMLDLGVDGFFTDYIDVAQEVIKQRI